MLRIWLGFKANSVQDLFSSPGSYFESNSTSLSKGCGHPDYPLLKNRGFQGRLLDPQHQTLDVVLKWEVFFSIKETIPYTKREQGEKTVHSTSLSEVQYGNIWEAEMESSLNSNDPECWALRAIRRNDWGFNPSLHVCNLQSSPKSQLHYQSPKQVYLPISSFTRSHQGHKEPGTSFLENLHWWLIFHVDVFIKFSFWILNFFTIRYWCPFGHKIKRGNLQSISLAFLCRVPPSEHVSDRATSQVALQRSSVTLRVSVTEETVFKLVWIPNVYKWSHFNPINTS